MYVTIWGTLAMKYEFCHCPDSAIWGGAQITLFLPYNNS